MKWGQVWWWILWCSCRHYFYEYFGLWLYIRDLWVHIDAEKIRNRRCISFVLTWADNKVSTCCLNCFWNMILVQNIFFYGFFLKNFVREEALRFWRFKRIEWNINRYSYQLYSIYFFNIKHNRTKKILRILKKSRIYTFKAPPSLG